MLAQSIKGQCFIHSNWRKIMWNRCCLLRLIAVGIIVLLSAPGVVRAQAKANAAKADAATADAAKATDQLKFEVYQDSAKEFRWRLVSGEDKDREVLATGGQGYKSKSDCMHGV